MAQQELVAGLCALQRLHQKDESPPRGRQTLRPQVHFATSRSKSQPASMQPTPEASQLTLPPIGKADVSPFQKAKAASNLQPKPQAASASNSPEKKNEWCACSLGYLAAPEPILRMNLHVLLFFSHASSRKEPSQNAAH